MGAGSVGAYGVAPRARFRSLVWPRLSLSIILLELTYTPSPSPPSPTPPSPSLRPHDPHGYDAPDARTLPVPPARRLRARAAQKAQVEPHLGNRRRLERDRRPDPALRAGPLWAVEYPPAAHRVRRERALQARRCRQALPGRPPPTREGRGLGRAQLLGKRDRYLQGASPASAAAAKRTGPGPLARARAPVRFPAQIAIGG